MAMDVQSVVEEKMEVFLTEAERLLRTRLIDLLFYFLIFLLYKPVFLCTFQESMNISVIGPPSAIHIRILMPQVKEM